MDELSINSYEYYIQTDLFLDKIAEDVSKHPNLTGQVPKFTNYNRTRKKFGWTWNYCRGWI